MSMVRYRWDEIPPISEERKKELRALAERPDSEIDLSDIPELDDDFWANAIPNPFYPKELKVRTAVELDVDVVRWLHKQGEGYLNTFLREAMQQRSMP